MAKNIGVSGINLATLTTVLFSVIIAVKISPQSSGVHQYMNRRELLRYFGTDKYEEVPDYEVVHPRKVNKNGEFLSHKLSHNDELHGPEIHKEKDLHYNIKAFGENFNLHLKKNHKLFAKDLKVEVLGHRGKILRKEKVRNCYYHGRSKNHHKSRATLSTCDNLAGAIHVDDQSYFIEPLPRHIADRYKRSGSSYSHPHIIYKSGSSRMTRRERSTVTKRKATFCGTEDNPRIRLPRELDVEPDSLSGDDSKDAERYIETLVVVDEKMCAFHGEDAAKQFTLAACNIASGLLKDSSIGSNPINLVITKMQIHTTPQEGLLINSHAMNSLSSFGKWAERNTVPDDSDPQHYDYATLFTRYDICKDKNQPCDTLGVTNVGGMCQFPNSVSICEDNGLMVGKTLAHETGHSLGMNHDLRPFCGDSKKMMSLHPGGSDAYEWSKCSRMFLKQFLDSSDSRCLEDRPRTKQAINVQMFNDPGLLYNADQQCALSYGDGAKHCKDKSPEEMCSQLWCSVPAKEGNNCRSLNQPLADGTACGEQKWCKRGKCVEKYTEGPDAIDGGWSNWSQDYTECTRSCSGGVQYRTRQCNNPLPTNGGKFCEGENREYQLCNTKKCVDETNFRNVQCEAKNKEMFNDKFFDWEWRPSNLINKCTLGCFIKNADQGYAFGNVEDGTNCDDDSDSKCINGECVHIGCDNVIGSSAKLDRCGVCNGDGSTCRYGNSTDKALKAKLTQKYKEQGRTFKKTLSLLQKMGYGVPEDYGSAKMDEVISDFYWAIIKSGCSATCGGGMEITKSECRRSDDGSPVAETNCDVKTKPTDRTTRCNSKPCQPEWRTDRWDDCSKTCNGGTRTRHARCVEIVDGGIEYDVEDEMCDADVKPNTKEKCNKQECRPEWVAQPFGTCSTSCGRGVQSRKITCQKVNKDGDTEDAKDEKCSDFIKPNSEEYCNVHNPCPGEGECGGEHSKNKGFITSPGFPDNYPNGKECMHSIIVPNDKVVKLVFKSLDLTGSVNSAVNGACTGDFVKIMDGDCITGSTDTRYCGNRNPVPFLSSGNKLCVKFFSDESRNSKGFNASFEAVDHPARPKDPCGSTITATVGLLASPNYPAPYPTNEMCNMTIKTLEGPIRLNFQYFDIGKDANCDDDYLLLQGDSDVSKLCGSNLPKTYNVSGKMLKLSFKSGQQNLNKIGFIATYVSGKEHIAKAVQDTNNADVKPNKLSEINSVNDLTDSVRDTIPRPSNVQQNSVEFLPISSNSLDSKEVAKEVSSHSSKVAVSAKSTGKDVKDKSASASITSTTGAESAKGNKVETSATADKKETRQTVLRPLQSVLEQSGALMTRGQCPSASRLSCINLLYSYPCQDNNACQLRGMDCCPTSCSYGPSMCVPKVWRECPLVTPYISKVLHTCQTTADCDANHICCIDMLGRRYCHKHEAIDK